MAISTQTPAPTAFRLHRPNSGTLELPGKTDLSQTKLLVGKVPIARGIENRGAEPIDTDMAASQIKVLGEWRPLMRAPRAVLAIRKCIGLSVTGMGLVIREPT